MGHNTTVHLIQPLGVRAAIYPWGLAFLEHHLKISLAGIQVFTHLLQHRPDLQALIADHTHVGEVLFRQLKREAMLPFGGPAGAGRIHDVTVYCAIFGVDILTLLEKNNCFTEGTSSLPATLRNALDTLHDGFTSTVDSWLRTLDSPASHLFAISVYDRTLPFAMWLSKRLRTRFPGCQILFGGDYFTFDNASELMSASHLVDGIVVGYGEDVLLHIVNSVNDGLKIPAIRTKGLVNAGSVARNEPIQPTYPDHGWLTLHAKNDDSLQTIKIPSHYTNPAIQHMRCVSRDTSQSPSHRRVLRVMLQRGCSYGKCTFCTQIDKRLYFRLNPQFILSELVASINAFDDSGPIEVSFDADEHAPAAMIDILNSLTGPHLRTDVEILVKLWFQTKYISPKIAHAIGLLRSRSNVHVMFVMNFETLNPTTLALMNKGHSPLLAVYGAKVVQDAGQFFSTNYMKYFPGEDENNVREECSFLYGSLHLLEGRVTLFPYAINGRDEVFQDQDRYGVRAFRMSKDFWLQAICGIDLPSSIWNYELIPESASATTKAWYQSLVIPTLQGDDVFESLAIREQAQYYRQRRDIFNWLDDRSPTATPANTGLMVTIEQATIDASPRLRVDRSSFGEELTIFHITEPQDLKLLRFLYEPKMLHQVAIEMGQDAGCEALRCLLDRHLSAGTVLTHNGEYLSTANDKSRFAELYTSSVD